MTLQRWLARVSLIEAILEEIRKAVLHRDAITAKAGESWEAGEMGKDRDI
jgi:hypothetical protein